MKKQAVIFVTYDTEEELNTLLASNSTHAEVSGIYEEVTETQTVQIKDILDNTRSEE
ncbi:hypothetical protein [Evansella clarkii]|uniref:hypothetical protein n=1 Tax=Evansella clarkii TaxID=79879 RepID=UPI001474AF3E|nr:hypothetical protein [Evansella clarkii]